MGQRVPLPMGKAVHELAALLHNGEVGSEIGIEHVVKAHLLQGGDHALRRGELRRQMVVLCPGHPDGGGHLYHGDLIGVGQSIEHLAGVIVLLQATHGTVGHALAAEGAVGLPQGAVLPPRRRWCGSRYPSGPIRASPAPYRRSGRSAYSWTQRLLDPRPRGC